MNGGFKSRIPATDTYNHVLSFMDDLSLADEPLNLHHSKSDTLPASANRNNVLLLDENDDSYSNETWRAGSAFAKTKLCSFHLRGMCSHGERCTFAHDITQLRVQPDLAKTRMCPLFRKGQCVSNSCTYAHSRDELRGTEDVYKTSMCRFWIKGRCSAGQHCRHAHGVDELRARESNSDSSIASDNYEELSILLDSLGVAPPGFTPNE